MTKFFSKPLAWECPSGRDPHGAAPAKTTDARGKTNQRLSIIICLFVAVALLGLCLTPSLASARRKQKPAPIGWTQTGKASWYGQYFHGRQTACGERYNMHAMTAAHLTLPFHTYVRVTNLKNGKSVVVKINDRGPYVDGRVIDLSRGAANKIDMLNSGVAKVKIVVVDKNGLPGKLLAPLPTHGEELDMEALSKAVRIAETVEIETDAAPAPLGLTEQDLSGVRESPTSDPEPKPDSRPWTVGYASYYGVNRHGQLSACGEKIDMRQLAAAHESLPFGTMAKVTCINTGRSVTVKINDRCKKTGGRVIDLSRAAAKELGMTRKGVIRVKVEVLEEAAR